MLNLALLNIRWFPEDVNPAHHPPTHRKPPIREPTILIPKTDFDFIDKRATLEDDSDAALREGEQLALTNPCTLASRPAPPFGSVVSGSAAQTTGPFSVASRDAFDPQAVRASNQV